jgi:hypothetical protein
MGQLTFYKAPTRISIRESIIDLECYRSAPQAMAQYAAEFDDSAAASCREHVAALSGDLPGEADAPLLCAARLP